MATLKFLIDVAAPDSQKTFDAVAARIGALDEQLQKTRNLSVGDKAAMASVLKTQAAVDRLRDRVTHPMDVTIRGAQAAEGRLLELEATTDRLDDKLGHLNVKRGFLSRVDGGNGNGAGALAALPAAEGLVNPYTVGAAAAASPFIAQAGAGAAVLGLGGALAGIGVLGALQAKTVTSAFGKLKTSATADLGEIGASFVPVMSSVFGTATSVLGKLTPVFAAAEKVIAGPFKVFSDTLLKSFGSSQVRASIGAVAGSFGMLLTALAPGIPGDVNEIATGIGKIAKAVAANPQAFATFVNDLFKIGQVGLSVIADLAETATYIEGHFRPALHDVAVIFDGVRHEIAHVWDMIYQDTFGAVARTENNVDAKLGRLRHSTAAVFDGIRNDIAHIWDTTWDNTVGRVQRGIADVTHWAGTLPGKIAGVFKNAGKWLYSTGQDIVHGLTKGIESLAGTVDTSLLNLIPGPLRKFAGKLGIKSPSTVFAKFGAMITAGLALGITKTTAQAENAATQLSAKVKDAFTAGQITAAQETSLLTRISSLISSRAARLTKTMATIGLGMSAGLISSLANATTASAVNTAVNKLIGYVKTAWSAGDITKSRASSLTAGLEQDNTRLQSLAAQRAKIVSTIATAKSYATSTATSVASGAQLSSLQSAAGGYITSDGIISGLQGQLTAIRQFSRDITRLKALGLSTDLLGQIIAAGPVDGDQLAQALISSGSAGIKQADQAQASITKASAALGQSAASLMYDSGAQAGKGFLSGLKAQQASITKLMETIARNMVATLKKELGIKSPSTITRQIGEFTGIGIEEGLLSRVRHVEGAASRLAVAAVPAPRQPAGGRPAQAPAASGGFGHVTVMIDGQVLEPRMVKVLRDHDKQLLSSARTGTGLNG